MIELAAFDFPAADVTTLQPEAALDELETTPQATGNAILKRVLQAQWDTIDAALVEQHRQRFSPAVVHEAHMLSDTTVRSLVRTHGQVIRLAEQAELAALLQHDDLATMALQVVPHQQP